jgi:hypothetical protein
VSVPPRYLALAQSYIRQILCSSGVSKNRKQCLASLLGFEGFSHAGLPAFRQLHATVRRESHPDVDARLLVIVGLTPADQFFFSCAFLAKADDLQKILAGHARGCA